jgi:hypothetical protein
MTMWDDFWSGGNSDSGSGSGSNSDCRCNGTVVSDSSTVSRCTNCGKAWEFKDPNNAGHATITQAKDGNSWW